MSFEPQDLEEHSRRIGNHRYDKESGARLTRRPRAVAPSPRRFDWQKLLVWTLGLSLGIGADAAIAVTVWSYLHG